MQNRNHYEILDISEQATPDEIRKAYHKKALQYHPDRNPNADTSERFKEASEANQVLSDNQKRAAYDADLARERNKRANQPSAASHEKSQTEPAASHQHTQKPFPGHKKSNAAYPVYSTQRRGAFWGVASSPSSYKTAIFLPDQYVVMFALLIQLEMMRQEQVLTLLLLNAALQSHIFSIHQPRNHYESETVNKPVERHSIRVR